MDWSLPGSSVHGILQAKVLEWVAIPSSRGIFPIQGLNPGLLHCRQILYHLSPLLRDSAPTPTCEFCDPLHPMKLSLLAFETERKGPASETVKHVMCAAPKVDLVNVDAC